MTAQLKWRLRWRLSVLWALQWGITGAILTYLPLYFTERGLTTAQLGQLMAVSAVGLWIAPFIVGQVCDRWMASEKYLAVAHFVGGLTLLCIPIATEVFETTEGGNFNVLLVLMGIYAVAYFPTIPLASSLSFRHLPDPDAQFGKVRIWGTVGWVLSGLSLSIWLEQSEVFAWLVLHLPDWSETIGRTRLALSWTAEPSSSDCFRIAALLSFALSSFCVFLPATPPARADRGSVAPLQVLAMFRDRTFTLLIAISFLLALVVPFYTFAVPTLLRQMDFKADWVPAVMTIGQISEFPALILLPWCLRRFGMKATFALGMGAWLVRYLLFAVNAPAWLVLTGIGLHGVCHVFLIIVVQLYVDTKCRYDIKASAQNLFAFLTMGIAMPAGFLAAGTLGEWCRLHEPGQENYQLFFAVPAVLVAGLLTVFWRWVGFSDAPSHEEAPRAEPFDDALSNDAAEMAGSK